MNEIITVGSEKYTVTNVKTGLNTISFKIVNPVSDDVEATFKDVKSLTVGTEKEVYGDYPDVEYESITIKATGEIIVTMRIPTQMELQVAKLQKAQDGQEHLKELGGDQKEQGYNVEE